jgi:hypothetical protein
MIGWMNYLQADVATEFAFRGAEAAIFARRSSIVLVGPGWSRPAPDPDRNLRADPRGLVLEFAHCGRGSDRLVGRNRRASPRAESPRKPRREVWRVIAASPEEIC